MKLVALAACHLDNLSSPDAAKAIFEAVGATDCHERQSSNYAEGRYFQGRLVGVTIAVSLGDSDYADLPIWIVFSGNDQANVDYLAHASAIQLKRAGFRVARLDSFGKLDEVRVDL